MILVIDNYDSFVFNLARYVGEAGYIYQVVRNDALTISEIAARHPSHILISPGPGTPDQAGLSMAIIQQLGPSIPLLGVCLGHQAIGQVFGGQVVRAQEPMHGKASLVTHDASDIFARLPNPLSVGRYHSLIVSDTQFPATLRVTARSERGEIMGLAHREYPIYGVQFHPESILTPMGRQMIENFLAMSF